MGVHNRRNPQEDSTRESKGLFFFESCHEAITQLPLLVRDPRDRDEIDAKTKDDHIVDAVRYRVMYSPAVVGCRFF